MKVKELIKNLKKLDQNANVFIYDLDCGDYLNIENVDDMENGQIDINVSSEETKDKEFIKNYKDK